MVTKEPKPDLPGKLKPRDGLLDLGNATLNTLRFPIRTIGNTIKTLLRTALLPVRIFIPDQVAQKMHDRFLETLARFFPSIFRPRRPDTYKPYREPELVLPENYKQFLDQCVNEPDYLPTHAEFEAALTGPDSNELLDHLARNFDFYEFLNKEFINALSDYLERRITEIGDEKGYPVKILEICAGNGRLTHFVTRKLNEKLSGKFEMVACDDNSWANPGIWSKTIKRNFPVEKIDHKTAMAKHHPGIVVCSWMPPNTDLTADLRKDPNLDEYLLIGEASGVCGRDFETWGIGRGPAPFIQDGFEKTQLSEISRHQICVNDKQDRIVGGGLHRERNSTTNSFRRDHEIAENLPDFQAVVDALDKGNFQLEEAPATEKVAIPERRQLEDRIRTFGANAFAKQLTVDSDHPAAEVRETEGVKKMQIPFDEAIVEDTIPLKITATKIIVIEKGKEVEAIRFALHNANEEICSIDCAPQQDGFEINHRYVQPKFRKQNFGSIILQACNGFVAEAADHEARSQVAFADVGQLDVMYWFWKNGYRPATNEDWEAFKKVLAADKELYMDEKYYIFEKNLPEGDKYFKNPETGALSLDHEGKKSLNFKNAFRIKFAKVILY